MRSRQQLTDEQIIEGWSRHRSVTKMSREFGVSQRGLHLRMNRLRGKGHEFYSPDSRSPFYDGSPKPDKPKIAITRYDARVGVEMRNGIILVGSDAHYWPGEISVAHKGFVRFVRELKPSLVVMNGDAFDGARVSRYPRIGWDRRPTVVDELKAVYARLAEIEAVANGAQLVWPLGNHDARFETRLAQAAPEYEGVKMFSLKEHFPAWRPCWSVCVNDDLIIKHRWKGGRYAPANNTLHSGVSYCTGHLHSLKWWPHTDERGTRYGIDTGTLADPEGLQFLDYTEDGPKDWRSGFAVLTIRDGQLLQPETAKVHGEAIDFRGTLVEV